MIGKHVVIDTLDNFKAKLSLIPSSAIVLIKDVGQIYAHGTYFGAQKTYSLLTKTADGLAPKGGTSASSLIEDGESEWVLTVTNGENPSWRRLPANAFNSSSYTLSSATTSDLGGIKVGQVYTATFDDLVGLYYKVNIDKNGLAYVHVPWINNPYTASGSGITLKDNVFSLSLNSVTKLDSAIGNKIYAVSLDKNGKLCVSVPWVDTNNIFVGATETINGSSGMVPAPIANQHRYFLRGDGTWVKPNLSDLNDDVVSGKYLPLSGGTLTASTTAAALWIQSGQTNDSAIGFKRKGQSDWAYITYRGDENWCVSNEGWTKNLTLYHSGNFNPSDYLPLSGGTIKGVLKINGNNEYNIPLVIETPSMGDWGFIQFHTGAKVLGHIGMAGIDTPVFRSASGTNNTLIHSGNISSQSVNYANSAGMLSACSLSDANTATYTDTSLRWFSMIPSNVSNLPTVTGWQNGLLAFPLHSNGVTAQLYFSATKKLYYRSIAASDYDWNEIAYVTDNVASATKLQTARTIWGQSFDGSDNISGSIDNCNWIRYYKGGSVSGYIVGRGEEITGGDGLGLWTYGNTPIFLGTGALQRMTIDSSGNVGIGTTSPSCKLDVNGDGRIAGIHFRGSFINLNRDGATSAIYDSTKTALEIEATSSISILRTYNVTNQAYIALHTNGNIGIGTKNPSSKLHVQGVLTLPLNNQVQWADSEGAMIYGTSSKRIIIDGSVGIGTANPAYKLDVNGDIATSLYLRIKAWSGYGSGSCDMWFDGNKTKLIMASGAVFGYNVDIEGTLHMTNDHKIFWHDDSANYYISSPNTATSAMLEYKAYGGHRFYGGNVGIGVESPEYKLHVSGSIYGSYGKFGGILINKGYGNNTGTDTIETATSGNMLYVNYYHKGGLNLCLGGGNVGIGTTSPAHKLDVNGSIYGSHYYGDAITLYTRGNGTYTRAWISAKDSAGDFIIEAPLTAESSGTRAPITLTWRGGYPAMGGLKITGYSEAVLGGNKIWHEGNDGSGSGLNADLLDGLDSTAFMRAVSANGYYGLAEPGGGTSNWIRTTTSGIIPYQSGGHGSLGTSSWPFSTVYANNFYGYLNGNISGSSASVRDVGNGTAITFSYSTGGFTSNPTWLAAWNGYKVTYVSPSVVSVNYATSAGSASTATQLSYKDFNFTSGTKVADYAKATTCSYNAGTFFSTSGWAWASSSNLDVGGYKVDRMRYSAVVYRNGNLKSTWQQHAVMFIPTYSDSNMIYLAQMTTTDTTTVSTSVKRYLDYDTTYSNIYNALVNGYASSAGNADTVDSYHISVTTSAGTNTSTIYFVT